jgi:hypothetical protein
MLHFACVSHTISAHTNLLPAPPPLSACSRIVGAVLLARLVLMPLMGIACVSAGVAAGILDPADSTLLFVLLLEASTPPAMNLQLICEVMGSGTQQMGRVLAVAYVASVFTLTAWISVFLLLVRGGGLGGSGRAAAAGG